MSVDDDTIFKPSTSTKPSSTRISKLVRCMFSCRPRRDTKSKFKPDLKNPDTKVTTDAVAAETVIPLPLNSPSTDTSDGDEEDLLKSYKRDFEVWDNQDCGDEFLAFQDNASTIDNDHGDYFSLAPVDTDTAVYPMSISSHEGCVDNGIGSDCSYSSAGISLSSGAKEFPGPYNLQNDIAVWVPFDVAFPQTPKAVPRTPTPSKQDPNGQGVSLGTPSTEATNSSSVEMADSKDLNPLTVRTVSDLGLPSFDSIEFANGDDDDLSLSDSANSDNGEHCNADECHKNGDIKKDDDSFNIPEPPVEHRTKIDEFFTQNEWKPGQGAVEGFTNYVGGNVVMKGDSFSDGYSEFSEEIGCLESLDGTRNASFDAIFHGDSTSSIY